jgi:hypothetical protein
MTLQYEEFHCSNYEPLTKALFVLYMFVMPIMVSNAEFSQLRDVVDDQHLDRHDGQHLHYGYCTSRESMETTGEKHMQMNNFLMLSLFCFSMPKL